MRAIWKFTVPIDDAEHVLQMPKGAKIVHTARQDGTAGVCFWADVDTRAKTVERAFTVVGTGQSFTAGDYVGTIQTRMGLVFHLLELT